MKGLTQFSRIFVGVLFIISGLIKANDTIGFSYKLEEYFELFNWPFFIAYAESLAMIICIFEIMCGVVLLLGSYARLNAWLLLLMIIFFTWLTGYSAITHKVTDCGCFGDAVKLKPFESFLKDLVLLVFILIIFFGVKHIKPLFNSTIQGILLFVALFVSTAFTLYTYMFLPVKDFLPYKVGNNIREKMAMPPGAQADEYELVFIYERDGKRFEFNANNLPADLDKYTFIERKDKLLKEGYKPPIHDFKVYDVYGTEYTDSLLNGNEYKLVLVQTHIEEGRQGTESTLRDLAGNWINQAHLPFWALTATSKDQIEAYRHEHQLPFHYYTMDATPLKSIVRSNPGLVLMKGSTVVKKWSAYNLPSYEIVKKYMVQ